MECLKVFFNKLDYTNRTAKSACNTFLETERTSFFIIALTNSLLVVNYFIYRRFKVLKVHIIC